jgi:hypothetical protein
MDDILLPRHVIDRLERRWANRLQQDAKAWSGVRGSPVRLRRVQSYGPRDIPVTVRRSRRAAGCASGRIEAQDFEGDG